MPKDETRASSALCARYDELAGVIEGLTALARTKRAALADRDIEAVDAAAAREEELFSCACRHITAIRAAAQPGGGTGARERPEDATLAAAKARVKKLVAQLAHEARLTELLARKSVAHFAGMLEILTGASSRPVTYSARGQERRATGSRLVIDARI